MKYLSNKIVENKKYIDDKIGLPKSFDVGVRELYVKDKRILFYYVTGLINTDYIIEIFKKIMDVNDDKVDCLYNSVKNHITHQQIIETSELDLIITQVLSGLMAVIIEDSNKSILIDVRDYPGRPPQEPDTEKVVRGSRDGFVENIILNTALVRRRVRDGRLRNILFQVGTQSKTDVCVMYIEGVANDSIVNQIIDKINNINIDELTMTDKALEELIVDQKLNPYPKVRYTERPDVVASHLYQGLIGIVVDTSPSMILTPTTIFDHIHNAEEYRQTPFVGSFMRIIRFAGILSSLFLVPIWFLFTLSPELLPDFLDFIGPKEEGNVPIIFQLLIAEVGVEFLRMAAIHTPSALSTAMGIIAGILVGQIAIDVGLFSPEIILYVAVSAIGAYATPSYELSLANKISKLFFIISTYFFRIYGLIISVIIWIVFLARIKTFGKGYLYPIYPFKFKEIVKLFIRMPKRNKKKY